MIPNGVWAPSRGCLRYDLPMKRRTFFGLPLAGAALYGAPMGKRERMTQWLTGKTDPNYTPAAFFSHFAAEYKNGVAAAKKHVEFFRYTDMDFVKIQFEQTYERQAFLQKPADWSKLGLRKLDFYEPLLVTVRELVKELKKEALVVMTLYSPYMCAGHCATTPVLQRHLEEDPAAVKKGLNILVESQMLFVRACVKAGVDGFYMSTQGGEAKQFKNPRIFSDYVKPSDLVAMKEVSKTCQFNILHVCDWSAPYDSYAAVVDYPGQLVNCNPKLIGKELAGEEIVKMFKRPYMGGMDRHGIIKTGTAAQIEAEVKKVVKSAPRQFILGADCTVDSKGDWSRMKQAIAAAHRVGR
jgi:uroporphyrinogen decarboxylase